MSDALRNLSTDWYWEQDKSLRFTRAEMRDYELLEKALGARILGKRRWEIGSEAEGGWTSHRKLLKARKPFRDLVTWRTLDSGSRRYISVSGEPVFDARGRFSGYRGIGRDITEQKRAEQLLRLEHAVALRLAKAAAARDAIKATLRAICETELWDVGEFWLADEARGTLCRHTEWARPRMAAARRFTDGSRNLVFEPGVGLAGSVWTSGEPLWIADCSTDPRVVRKELTLRTGLHAALLFPVRYGGRVMGVLSFTCSRIREPDQRLLQSLNVIGTQIGQLLQRTQAEQAMRESEARFRSLTDLSSDWYWEQDAEYRFVRIEGRNVTGGSKALRQHLMGKARWESGLETEGGWEAHRAILDARKPFHDVLMSRTTPEGDRRYISVSGEPTFGPDGRFVGYRGVGRDVTAQKRAEDLLRLEHHVARALAQAEDAASGLQAALQAFCEAEQWACGLYFGIDEAAGVLRLKDAWCIRDPAVEQFVSDSRGLIYRPGEGLAGLVWQSGDPIWSADTTEDPRARSSALAARALIGGAFVFTVDAGDKTLGVISFHSQAVRKPDQRLLQAARVIGTQIGQFLQRKQAEEALRESEARFRSLTQMSSDFFWETDAQHRFTQMVHGPNYVAKFSWLVTGKTAWELPANAPAEDGWANLRATFEAHEPFRDFEFGRPSPDGSTRYFSVSGEPRFGNDGSFLGYRGVGRETTEIALAREHIASLAYSDALTGLANRSSLAPAFEQALERARRRSAKLAAVFMDLDGFKPINDAHGHHVGDRLLIEVARRLRANLRASDLVARLGGDEFFAVLEDMHEPGALEQVALKLLDEIRRPYDLVAGEEIRISASIGISIFPDDAADTAMLMKHADMAMYSAKQAGKNGFRFYAAGDAIPAPARSSVS